MKEISVAIKEEKGRGKRAFHEDGELYNTEHPAVTTLYA